ncbi:MAG: choice-of-anchor J domain-containing protein, partial [Muribaculaceae bacterium]|nr:choice-of-anchor J domain-containing protein [Muribaculaceae bacterium]
MKKFLLAIASVAAMSFVANAEPVTLNVNDAEDIQGTWVDEKVSGTQTTAAHYQPLTSLMLGGYTFEFSSTNTNANSQPAYYHATSTNENQQKTIRVYKDTKMTITAPEGVTMYAIDTKGSNGKTTYTGTCNNGTWTFASTSTTTWKGETNKLEVTFSGTYRITELTITTGEGGDTPVIPDTKTVLYSENFKAGFGTWTTENVTLPEGLTYVWTSTAQYGAKASAFANKTTYAADSYLVSEVFDFTKVTEPVLTFSQAMNMFTSIETAKQECSVLARVEGATEWTALTVPTYPSSLSWGFVETGDIDLAAYAGKKFQIAFRYTSTAAKAGTWEVTDFVLKGIGELPQPEVETSNATRATSAEAGTYFFTIGNEVAGNLAETATYGFLPLTDKNATFTAGK